MKYMLKIAGMSQEDIEKLTNNLAKMFNNREDIAMNIVEYNNEEVSLEKVLEVDEILEHKTNDTNYKDYINRY